MDPLLTSLLDLIHALRDDGIPLTIWSGRSVPLREALTGAGFENVATYINSGNAVLRSHLSREKVIAVVAKLCEEKFGFTKAIDAPTLEVWEALITNNPFPDFKEGKHVHAAILAGDPPTGAVEALREHAVQGEAIELVAGVVYLYTPFGLGTSKLGEKFDRASESETPPATGTPCSSCRSWRRMRRDKYGARPALIVAGGVLAGTSVK